MARLGGIISFLIDGVQYQALGKFEVTPSRLKREGVAGQDYVHGYRETPVVPSIKGDFSTPPGLSLTDLENITDSTIQANMANGTTYVLRNAWSVPPFTIRSEEGAFSGEFQGISCDEI